MHYKHNMEAMDMTKIRGNAQNINCDMILWWKQIL